MVADDVAVTAAGTGDQDGAVVVALLGDFVAGAVTAGDAGEGQLVMGLLGDSLGRLEWSFAF